MIDKAALARQVAEARKSLISQGGIATLRFGVSQEHGFQASNSRKVCEALCALWNAAPQLLGFGGVPLEVEIDGHKTNVISATETTLTIDRPVTTGVSS